MSIATPSRRSLIKAGLGAGGALLLAFSMPAGARRALLADPAQPASAGPPAAFQPNAVVRIEPNDAIILTMSQVEMGQAAYTAMSMLIAEELEVELSQVTVVAAPPDDRRFANPLLGFQNTGGSTSVRGFFKPLREAGAIAREMLVGAAAQYWQVDPASCRAERGRVHHPSSGRSLGYGALAGLAAAQPVPSQVRLKSPDQFRLIGTSAKRIDTPSKVNGTARFGIDVRLPEMKVATVTACPVLGGRLRSVDPTPALAVRGVRQVVRLADAVAVVADHMGAARKGLEALTIHWEEGPNAALSTEDVVGALRSAADRPGAVAVDKGDVRAAMEGAAQRVEARYELPFLAHAAMEPINCTVRLSPTQCEVWVGTQTLTRAQQAAAEAAGMPVEQVVVHNQLLGGGFGRRLDVDSITQAVLIARQARWPVKVVWTREEDTQHDLYRPYYHDRMAAGLDAGGNPVAFHHRVAGSSIMARWLPAAFANGLDRDAVHGATGPYEFANAHVDYVQVEPPEGLRTAWWRGVGVTHNAFMVESFLDELAAKAGQDPVAYRRRLLGQHPWAKQVLDLAAAKSGWGSPLGPRRGRGVALIEGWGATMAQVAEVAVARDGTVRVERVVCAVHAGIIVNPDTVRAQIEGGIIFGLSAALYGEITLRDGRVEQGNFDTYRPLRIDEAPAIEVHIIQSSEEPGGMGEPGTAAIAPALANAIFAATGVRLRKLPIDPGALAIA